MPQDDLKSENDWVQALKGGSHRAFEQLYHRYKHPIYLNLLRLVHQHEVAEELTHDVFLKIWQLREEIDVNKSFSAFIRRIAGNLAIDFYRRAALDKKMQEELIKAATERLDAWVEEINRTENQVILKSVMQKLPPRRREIFTLCKLEGRSYSEVAHLFGISQGTVNDHIVKATKFLRGELVKYFLVYIFISIV